jgi:hypothetical protein
LRNYIERREAAVYPRLVSPRVFALVWIVVGLLFSAALVAWAARVPVYSSGVALALNRSEAHQWSSHTATMVVLLPSTELSHLRVGQRVFLDPDKSAATADGEVIAVEPQLLGAAAIRDRFGLAGPAAAAMTEPMAVAVSKFEQLPDGFDYSPNVARLHGAFIETGTRRVISLFHL